MGSIMGGKTGCMCIYLLVAVGLGPGRRRRFREELALVVRDARGYISGQSACLLLRGSRASVDMAIMIVPRALRGRRDRRWFSSRLRERERRPLSGCLSTPPTVRADNKMSNRDSQLLFSASFHTNIFTLRTAKCGLVSATHCCVPVTGDTGRCEVLASLQLLLYRENGTFLTPQQLINTPHCWKTPTTGPSCWHALTLTRRAPLLLGVR